MVIGFTPDSSCPSDRKSHATPNDNLQGTITVHFGENFSLCFSGRNPDMTNEERNEYVKYRLESAHKTYDAAKVLADNDKKDKHRKLFVDKD